MSRGHIGTFNLTSIKQSDAARAHRKNNAINELILAVSES